VRALVAPPDHDATDRPDERSAHARHANSLRQRARVCALDGGVMRLLKGAQAGLVADGWTWDLAAQLLLRRLRSPRQASRRKVPLRRDARALVVGR